MVSFSDDAKHALDAFITPVWVLELPRVALIWANQSALALFGAPSVSELRLAQPMAGVSAVMIAELARLPPGARLESEFRIPALGVDDLVSCTITGLNGEHGERLALVEAHSPGAAPASLRAPDVEQRLQSRDRMASIGTLTAAMVHGINNPLSYVIANLEYVKRLLAKGPGPLPPQALAELADVLDDSLDGAERVRRIVGDLSHFSRPREARGGAVDLERAADRALSVAANEIRHRARIVREFAGVPAAVGSESKLGQVILNVLINAAHAIEPGAVDSNVISLRTRLDASGRPTLEIEDTGCGIAAENVGRVFDPFFTTKPVGVGTGLGLSIAHRIVRELDGEIQLHSVHGKGTRVVVSLPLAPTMTRPAPAMESVAPFSTERVRARVLVVDDEPAILRSFRRVLVRHEVSLAASGAEAMAKLADGAAFDVVFCDVMMPEMSGTEVYQRIRDMHPGQEQKLVFMTGGAFDEPAALFIESVPNPTLKKPFTASAVRALLESVMRLA